MNIDIIVKELSKKGYKSKLSNIDGEEYLIITNDISSCAIQIENDAFTLYEIGYDFDLEKYFLYFRNENIESIDSILLGIEFLIGEISKKYIENISHMTEEKKEFRLIEKKELLLKKNFKVIDLLKNNKNYILISKCNKKWIAISYTCDSYMYYYVYKSANLSIESIHKDTLFDMEKVKKMLQNSYNGKIYSF